MSFEWSKGPLGNFIQLKRGYDLPAKNRDDGDIPVVSSSGITGWHSSAKVSAPGVVIGRYGTIGKVFYLSNDYWPLNTTLYVQDFKGNDPRFLGYLLESLDYSPYSDKAAVPGLNRNHLHEAIVKVPKDTRDQRRIASVLACLDNKIDINNQLARTYESIAQTIFKSWFIDFDPVKAKMEGREPAGMDSETAALFPTRLVESELGIIPEGWRIAQLGDLGTMKGGSTPPTKDPRFWEGGTRPWITPKDMSALPNKVVMETNRSITDAGVGKISSGILPEGTVLMSSRAPVGYLAIAKIALSINQGFIALIPDKGFPNIWILHRLEASMEAIKGNAGGSTFAEISKRVFKTIPVLTPPVELALAFDQKVSSMFDRLASIQQENLILASMRDLLLPKLISGEIVLGAGEAGTSEDEMPLMVT